MTRNILFISTLLIMAISDGPLFAAEADIEFDEDSWLEDDGEFRALEVNEGALTFIEPVKDKAVLHSEKELTVTETSLASGWVRMRQCYYHISPIAITDIVYRYKQIRDFKILSTKNIGKALTEGQVVHLHNVSADASLCVTAEVNVFEKQTADDFVINSGPYYQQFLDGYYPYHVSLTINYPEDHIRVSQISPPAQPLFHVFTGDHQLKIDAWFEGVLTIKISFQRKLMSQK